MSTDIFVSNGIDDAPVATDAAAASTTTSVTFSIASLLGNDVELDGDTLTLQSRGLSTLKGTLTNNGDGTLTYSPGAAFADFNLARRRRTASSTPSVTATAAPTRPK